MKRLAQLRLEDAVFLFQATRYSSAYYLAGYSGELALKACIAKLVQPDSIPNLSFVKAIYTHRFESLLSTAGLKPEFDAAAKVDPQLAAHWAIANNWSEDSRYEFWDQIATGSLVSAIADPAHGVFEWVKQHW
ncbi:MAG TPA: DNA-binding protein [Thermoanaerobaculia bacterium]|nr:DNA-binding protein [Thermoanaerobaculia bacterium]